MGESMNVANFVATAEANAKNLFEDTRNTLMKAASKKKITTDNVEEKQPSEDNSEASSDNTDNKKTSDDMKNSSKNKNKVASFVATAETTSKHVLKNAKDTLKKAMSKKKIGIVNDDEGKAKDDVKKAEETKEDPVDKMNDQGKGKEETNNDEKSCPVVETN